MQSQTAAAAAAAAEAAAGENRCQLCTVGTHARCPVDSPFRRLII